MKGQMIGCALRERRIRCGMTCAELAWKIGTSRVRLGLWELGWICPEERYFDQLMALLGITSKESLYWDVKEWIAHSGGRGYVCRFLIETLSFIFLTLIAFLVLDALFSRLLYAHFWPVDISSIGGWVLWFAELILAPAIGYYFCGSLTNWLLRLFKKI